jgi:hypothetical protein
MKKFVITTTSESGDDYVYFIEHSKKPTVTEINNWLIINGSDIEDGYCYENVNMIIEVVEFKKL